MHAATVLRTRVLQRLVDGQVGVLQLDVLADQRDLDLFLGTLQPLGEVEPLAEICPLARQPELLAHELIETFGLQARGNEIHVGNVGRSDDRALLDVGEEGDLLPDVDRQLLMRAADDDVRVDTDAP